MLQHLVANAAVYELYCDEQTMHIKYQSDLHGLRHLLSIMTYMKMRTEQNAHNAIDIYARRKISVGIETG